MTTLYGISNCDTIKKAKKYLTDKNIEFSFHDYRKDGISKEMVTTFSQHIDWQDLLNKRGTTYRQLSDEQKQTLDKDKALDLLVEHPAMIKRPVLIHAGSYYLGFKAQQYDEIFAA
ncbi:MAG: ArsC family reductase [Pseudoalteromonas sp.]|uniref:ArsC family reductase n=1 Tax=Pseudoalteromonas sp. KS88 TaxID=2109918 RepID=UPI001081542E|nr:ArsC family reductase [Pseudoalteromonas sp. KS88]TGE81298.1 ArsC family reductase [Pseudoalteromonas sp. KS88]